MGGAIKVTERREEKKSSLLLTKVPFNVPFFIPRAHNGSNFSFATMLIRIFAKQQITYKFIHAKVAFKTNQFSMDFHFIYFHFRFAIGYSP